MAKPKPRVLEVKLERQSVDVNHQLVQGRVAILQLGRLHPRHLAMLGINIPKAQLPGPLKTNAILQEHGHPLLAQERILGAKLFFIAESKRKVSTFVEGTAEKRSQVLSCPLRPFFSALPGNLLGVN